MFVINTDQIVAMSETTFKHNKKLIAGLTVDMANGKSLNIVEGLTIDDLVTKRSI